MRRLLGVLFVLGLCLSACNRAAKTARVSDHTGTYRLVTINGNDLPYTPPHEGGAPQVLSSTLTLHADGTFSMTMGYGTTPGDTVTRDFGGTYVREDSVFHFQWKGAGRTPATLEGNTLTIDNEGILFAYRK